MEIETYNEMSRLEDRHWWFVARRHIIKELIKKSCATKPMRVLEVGSGTGGNSQMLKSFGQLDSLEKNSHAIELAQLKNPEVNYQSCDVPEELSKVPNQTYDLIVMLDVLEHIQQDAQTVKALKSKLKDNGMLIVSAPAHPALWSQHDVVHHHFRRYKKKQLIALVEESGMVVKYHTYINCFLAPIVFSVRLLNRVFRRKHQNDEKMHAAWINNILRKIFSFEGKLIPRFRLPIGISHLILIKMTDN